LILAFFELAETFLAGLWDAEGVAILPICQLRALETRRLTFLSGFDRAFGRMAGFETFIVLHISFSSVPGATQLTCLRVAL
jgi:hypothetical protein